MATKPKVAVLRTQPETVLQDYKRLFELAGGARARSACDDGPQRQHHLAFPDAEREHDALATRGDDSRAARRGVQRSGLRTKSKSWGRLFQKYQQEGVLAADLSGFQKPDRSTMIA